MWRCCLKRPIFPPYERAVARRERSHATLVSKGHGRVEKRTLTATSALAGYLDWPGAKQAFQLIRERTVRGVLSREILYGITSLSPEKADAATLLAMVLKHWRIETHFLLRDVALGEDACRVRKGTAPRLLARLRDAAIHLLHRIGAKNLAARMRLHAAQPQHAINVIRTH